MYISDLSFVLFRTMLVVSVDLKNFTSSGLGRLLSDLNLPNQKKSLIALDSIEESISCNEVSKLLRSSFNLVSLFVLGGFSAMPYATTF